MSGPTRITAAIGAQTLAQALTAWSIVFAVLNAGDIPIWLVAPLLAAAAVPLRHNGSFRDRAVSNFGASVTVGGVMWWEVIAGFLDGVTGGGQTSPPYALIMVGATVLFAVAGGLFWTTEEFGR